MTIGAQFIGEAAIGTDKEESTYLKYLSDTIRWLKVEEFIRYESEDHGDFRKVTLTLKGLGILNNMPKSLRDKRSLIQRIREALSDQAANLTADLAKSLVSELLKGMIKGGI